MKKNIIILLLFNLLIISSYSQGQKPTSFPLKPILNGTEELYTQKDNLGIANKRFYVSSIKDYILNIIGTGTGVTNFSFINLNGISGIITNPTTTPTLTLSLGAITPSSIITPGNVIANNISGINTGNQFLTFSNDTLKISEGNFIVIPTPKVLVKVGTNVTDYQDDDLKNKTILLVYTDNLVRIPTDYSYTSITGTISFLTPRTNGSIIQILYK